MQLELSKPIVFFDLETTGVQVGSDHIVEICLYKVNPDGSEQEYHSLVRPATPDGKTIHIPAETTAIHGITDQMVANEHSFKDLAQEIKDFIGDADLGGYNSNKFDVPMLVEEFLRVGVPFDLKNRYLVDVQNIFHKMEQRTLKAAYQFYCGKNLDNAHSADADTLATYEVLKAQLDRYKDVEFEERDGTKSTPVVNNIAKLSAFSCNQQWADLAGFIGYDKQHKEVFNFGKHKGLTLEAVFQKEPAYFDWILKSDFPLYTKEVVKECKRKIDADKVEQLKAHFGQK